MKNILQNLLRSCWVLLLFGCSSGSNIPAPSYGGAPPVEYSRPPVKPSPDYYYSQPAPRGGQPYGQPPQGYQQPYQRQAPQTYAYPPASRAYSNPYSFQAPAQYPYYDSCLYRRSLWIYGLYWSTNVVWSDTNSPKTSYFGLLYFLHENTDLCHKFLGRGP